MRAIDVSDGMKPCTACLERKPLDEFHRDRFTKSGRTSRCKVCAISSMDSWRRANPERFRANGRESMKRQRARARAAVLAAYGDRCACCGESESLFLALDHVANDGKAHRRELAGNAKRSAPNHRVYQDVIRRGFPADFQLLCHNCNMAKAIAGVCPHQQRVEQAS